MRSLIREIDCSSRSDRFEIIPLGDVHLGAAACDEKLFHETVDYIKNTPNCFWLGMGDMIEAIARNDKRHNEETLAPWLHGKGHIITLQRDRLMEILRPIGDKAIAYAIGNHELFYQENSGSDLYYSVMEEISPDNHIRLGMAGFLILRFKREVATSGFTFYIHHGFGGGDMMGGSALKLERMSETYDADLYLMGHTHRKLAFSTPIIGVNRRGAIVAKTRLHINTGTYLKCALQDAVTYSEKFGKKPLVLGSPVIEIKPWAEGEKVHVTL